MYKKNNRSSAGIRWYHRCDGQRLGLRERRCSFGAGACSGPTFAGAAFGAAGGNNLRDHSGRLGRQPGRGRRGEGSERQQATDKESFTVHRKTWSFNRPQTHRGEDNHASRS